MLEPAGAVPAALSIAALPTTTSRLPLGRAHLLASTVLREARRAGLPTTHLLPVGSLRRWSPDIGDVTVLARSEPGRDQALLDAFTRLPFVVLVHERQPDSVTIGTDRGAVTLHVAPPERYGAALAWHTGSRAHTSQLQARATARGLSLDGRGLRDDSGATVPTPGEEDLYARLGLPFIAPELREGIDEIATAEAGALPQLVSDLHIRGDLHMHSTWSDGRNSIEEMVRAARELGYEYVAITDHSQSAWSSRKLAADEVPRQREELDELRTRISGIQVLHGIEVDIMRDGSLDFDDDLLATFDIVLASLHDHGGQEGSRLLQRYLQAIAHPLVNVITHPANRSPAQNTGYELNFDELFAAAVETGTAMEIDGAPGHLDMDGILARRAAAAGVMLTIDSDCHRAEALGRQMRFGVGTARRGWIEPRHVLNTRSVDAVREFVARKRAR